MELNDLAMLGLGVESDGLNRGKDSLGQFKKAAKGASDGADKFTGSTGKANAASVAMSKGVSTAIRSLGGLAAAYISVISAQNTITSARQFSASMGETKTLIAGTVAEMRLLEKESRALTNTFGGTATEKTKAFYQAISAGAGSVEEAAAMLDQANRLAIGGVTDITTATDGLTTAVNAYAETGLSAMDASDALFVGMKAGKTTIGELSAQLGQIVPIASSAGVSFEEVVAGVSALTTQGQSTAMATTGLRASIIGILQPSKQASDAAKALGLDFSAAGLEAKGLAQFMDDVIVATGGNTDQLTQLFGSVEALNAVLAFSGAAGTKFTSIMEQMGTKTGSTDAAFKAIAETSDFRLIVSMGKLSNLALSVGQVLLTGLVPAVELLASGAEVLADNFNLVLGVVTVSAAALTATYIPAIYAAVVGTSTWVASLITLRGALLASGLGAFIVLGGYAVGKLLDLVDAAGGWGLALRILGTVASNTFDGIIGSANAIKPALASVWNYVAAGFLKVIRAMSSAWADFMHGVASQSRRFDFIPGMESTILALNGAAIQAGSSVHSLTATIDSYQDAADSAANQARTTVSTSFEKASASLKLLNLVLAEHGSGSKESDAATSDLIKELLALNDASSKAAGGTGKATKALDKAKTAAEAYAEALADAAKTSEELGKEKANILVSGVDSVVDAWADFLGSGFSDFDQFKDNIVDSFKTMLSDMISLAAKNKIVIGLQTSATGGAVGTAAAATGAAGGTGSAGGLLGLLSGGSLLSAASTGVGIATSALFGAGGGLGTYFGALGAQAGSVFAGGFSATALSGLAGMALPIIGVVALIAKGLSRKYAGSGIRGNFNAEGFDGAQFDFYKGGFLRSNRTDTKALDSDFEAALDTAMFNMADGVVAMANSLNLGTDALKDFQGEAFQIWVNGKSTAEIQEELQNIINDTGSAMAALVLDTEDFRQVGEEALDTLSRLSGSLLAVNDAADLLGHRVWDVSLLIADAASDLVDAFGGMEAMAASVGTYWTAFYTEAEQQETAVRRLTEQMNALGVAFPTSRENFRLMVEAIDTTSSSGRQLYADLIGLSGALDAVLGPLAGFTPEVAAAIGQVSDVIEAQISERQSLSQEMLASSRLWLRTAETLREFIVDLRSTELGGLDQRQILEATAMRYADTFAAVQTGDQEAAGNFVSDAKSYLSATLGAVSTLTDYRRVAAKVQNDSLLVAGVSEFEGAKDQYISDAYQAQISVLREMQTLLQSGALTDEAITELNGTIASLQEVIEGAELLSYSYLQHNLQLVLDLVPSADIPPALQNVLEAAGGSISTLVELLFTDENLTPGLRFLLAGEAINAIGILELAISAPTDRLTRLFADGVLDSTAMINAAISEGTPSALAEMLASGELGVLTEIKGRIIGRGDAANLLHQIGEATTSLINIAGRFSFDPSADLESWFSDAMTVPVQSLETAINNLTDEMGLSRAADEAAVANLEAVAAVQSKLDKFDDNWGAKSTDRVADRYDTLQAMSAQYAVSGSPALPDLRMNDDGTVHIGNITIASGGSIPQELGDLIRSTSAANDNLVRADAYEQRLLDNLAGLQSFSGGGDTGNGSRTGGLDGEGGFLAMLHPQENVYDRTRGQAPNTSSTAMASELRNLHSELVRMREDSMAVQQQLTKNTDRSAYIMRKWDTEGMPTEREA